MVNTKQEQDVVASTNVIPLHLHSVLQSLDELEDAINLVESHFEQLHDCGRMDLIYNYAGQYQELLKKREEFRRIRQKLEEWKPGTPFPFTFNKV